MEEIFKKVGRMTLYVPGTLKLSQGLLSPLKPHLGEYTVGFSLATKMV